jgi:hypothetical protein
MRSLVLFNNKGGVGKTALTFNIAHRMARKGLRVVVLDYDPQCNISAVALSEESLFDIWERDPGDNTTVARCVDLVRRGKGDVRSPELVPVADRPRRPPAAEARWSRAGPARCPAARSRATFTSTFWRLPRVFGPPEPRTIPTGWRC